VSSPVPFVGRHLRSRPAWERACDLAWAATLRSVAHRQRARRRRGGGLAVQIEPGELLAKARRQQQRRLLLLLVDISGSMGGELTGLAKRLVTRALRTAYWQRDQVAMIAFREREAQLCFGPTDRIERAHRILDRLETGGTTPLASGLRLAGETLRRDRMVHPARHQDLLIVSDGRANVGSHPGHEALLAEVEAAARQLAGHRGISVLFLDTTAAGKVDLPARRLAFQLGARRIPLGKGGAPG
jgi:magnesium chelatase subunit D